MASFKLTKKIKQTLQQKRKRIEKYMQCNKHICFSKKKKKGDFHEPLKQLAVKSITEVKKT